MKYAITFYAWCVGGLYYTAFLFIALILSFLLPVKRFDFIIKAMMRGFFKVLFIDIEVHGAEKIKTDTPYIFMLNHVSFFDIPLVGGFIPTFARGIEASRQHKWPLYGWVMRRLGNIPVERDNIYASLKSYGHAEKFIAEGNSLIIFPEGGRTKTGQMKPFKKLPFHFAKKTQCPIVPVGISGMYAVNNKNSWLIRPGKVTVRFGQTIHTCTPEPLETLNLREITQTEIEKLIL